MFRSQIADKLYLDGENCSTDVTCVVEGVDTKAEDDNQIQKPQHYHFHAHKVCPPTE